MKIRARTTRLTALGAHIYAGGFSIGVREAGFQLLGHLEEWPFGVATSKANLGVRVWQGVDSWEDAVEKHAGKIDFFYANPPCAAWSLCGCKGGVLETERWKTHPLTACTLRVFGLIPQLDPRVFAWESVTGAMAGGRAFVDERTQEMNDLGFRVYHVMVDGAKCGVPQHRKRFFFVASKVRIRWAAPEVEPPSVKAVLASLGGPQTPLRTPSPALLRLLRRMPKGIRMEPRKQFMADLDGREPPKDEKGRVIGKPPFSFVRLGYDKLAPTIVGACNYFHPEEARYLTVAEQAALCCWPEGYKFKGPLNDVYAQIGKAVMPPTAEWLARNVHAALEANEPTKPGVVELDFIH